MGGFSTQAAFQTAYANEDRNTYLKFGTTNTQIAANSPRMLSFWQGTNTPTAGGTPGAAAVVTNTTSGALQIRNITTGKLGYLSTLNSASLTQTASNQNLTGTLFLYDRLIQSGGLSGTDTTAQVVNTPALPARLNSATGVDVEAFIEIYTTVGNTSSVATVSYTDSGGTAGRTATCSFTSVFNKKSYLFPLPAQAGAIGWKSIETVTLSVSTGNVGNFGVVLAWRVGMFPPTAMRSPYMRMSAIGTAFAPIHASSCLWFACNNGSNAASTDLGFGGMLGITEEP